MCGHSRHRIWFEQAVDKMMWALQALEIFKSATQTAKEVSREEAETRLILLSQNMDPSLSKLDDADTRSRGPLVRQVNGVVAFRVGLPNGLTAFQPVLPRSCRRLRGLIASDLHRQSHHGGVRAMMGMLRFHVPRFTSTLKYVVKHCPVCQTLRAHRTWDDAPSATPQWSAEWLSKQLPYTVTFIDFLKLDEVSCLTVVCAFTRHTTWKAVPNHSRAQKMNFCAHNRGVSP